MSDAAGQLTDGFHLLGLTELVFQPLALGDVAADAQHPRDPACFQQGGHGEFADGVIPVLLADAGLIDGQRFSLEAAAEHVLGESLVVGMHEQIKGLAQPVGHVIGRDGFKSGTDGGKGCVGRQGENNVTRGFHEQAIAMLGLAQQVLGPLALGDVNQGSDKAGDFSVRIALGDRLADDPHHRAIGTEKAVLGVIRNAGGDRGGPAGHDPAPVLRMQGRRPVLL